MEEGKILTLHPNGKNGARMDEKKYILIRDAILKSFDDKEEYEFKELSTKVEEFVGANFDGFVRWYVTNIKLDLEARDILEEVRAKNKYTIKMKQKKEEDIFSKIKLKDESHLNMIKDIRDIVLSVDSDLKETIKYNNITFVKNSNVVGFRSAKDHLTLVFYEGSHIEDKDNLFDEGSSKNTRSITFKTKNDISKTKLKKLIKKAIQYDKKK